MNKETEKENIKMPNLCFQKIIKWINKYFLIEM